MMRFAFNPFYRAGVVSPGPADRRREVIAFHRSLPGYEPTPLLSLRAAGSLGLGTLLIKDESRRFGIKAFKALGASWALHALVEERRAAGEAPPRTVASATDGNHGRAVAWAARRLALEAVIFIPAHAAPARLEAIRREGARVVPVEGTYDDTVARAAAEAARNGWQVIADTGYEGYLDIPRRVAEGYSTLFQETDAQIEERLLPQPDVVMLQGGVGALAAAAVDHYRQRRNAPKLVVVEPVASDCLLESILSPDGQPRKGTGRQDSIMAGLNCGLPSLAAWPTLRRGIDLFLSIEDRYAAEAVRLLWTGDQQAFIEAGESGAAGVAGLLALGAPEFAEVRQRLGLGPSTCVLALNTEGATDPAGIRSILGPEAANRAGLE
ncbi:MAG TPA: diaminopropionate ammonia-lyase [Candidatus Polarisedimenticolia bacterium]|nr:diaminopropionate ammonia-lyase [Candidatus Polarisedimenticolia bacterium]